MNKVENPKEVAKQQADDEALWCVNLDGTLPINEAILQNALRRLHAAVEGIIPPPFVQQGKFCE